MHGDAEDEYRAHLLRLWRANSLEHEGTIEELWAVATRGFERSGRGVVLLADDGAQGSQFFIPLEYADLQFGEEARRLCECYRPEDQCVLVAFTNGHTFAIVMTR